VVAEISTRPRCKTLGTMRGNTTHRLSGRLCSRIIATLCSAHNQKIREQIDTLASNNRSNTMKKRRSLFPGSFRVIQSPRHIDSRIPDRHTTLTTCMRLSPRQTELLLLFHYSLVIIFTYQYDGPCSWPHRALVPGSSSGPQWVSS
jgi:hypothetical protein